ncbi:MAG TPA: DUF922 domain-containing protein [Longimicrobium sp.]|nr:DUF922 domain-containing protein [Longimicrobium sp.]
MAMRSIFPPVAVCLFAAACAFTQRPRPVDIPAEANLHHRYYRVAGGSVGELLASLQSAAPEATQTDTYFARTTWTVIWQGDWTAADSTCGVISSHTRLESQMALPRWETTGGSADLTSDWNNFVRSLALHESGHVLNAVAASREVDSRLRNLRAPSCDVMEVTARATIDSVVAVFRAQDAAYDARTRHGEVQGAVWPPRAARNMRQPGAGEVFRNAPLNTPAGTP